jgi:hypothetical protein
MSTTKETISNWFDEGIKRGATNMIIVCDSYDHIDYPVYISPDQSVRDVETEYKNGKHSMQRIMEIYSLRGDKNSQMNEYRAFHYE